jgi:RecA-family ATPase
MAALQMMFATASGSPWLGEKPTRTGSALYVSEEGARAKVAERLSTMRFGHNVQHPIHVLHREGITLTGVGWQKVRATLDEMERPTVVVLDTLAALMDGDENSVADIRTALRPIQALITDYGVTVVLVHHINKGGEGRMGNRMRGSSALWGACDGTLGFVRTLDADGVAEDHGEVHVETKDNDPAVLEFAYDYRTMDLRVEERPILSIPNIIAEVERRQRETNAAVPIEDVRRYFRAGKGAFRDRVEEAENYGLVKTADGYYKTLEGMFA